MRPSFRSLFFALLAALVILHSDCTTLETLSDEMLALVLRHLPTDLSLPATSKRLRQLSMVRLNEEYSTQYIQNETFRNKVNANLANPRMQVILHLGGETAIPEYYIADIHNYRTRIKALLADPRDQLIISLPVDTTLNYIADRMNVRESINNLLVNHRKQVRLNLGENVGEYMINPEFRANIDNLVDNPLDQIWSDVEHLDLDRTQVADIKPLARLVKLKTLDLVDTQVSDIRPLVRLVNLRTLDLSHTEIADISPLGSLVSLEWLDLRGVQLVDIYPLAGMVKLRILHLDISRVNDIRPLARLANLEILHLYGSQVRKFGTLGGLLLRWLRFSPISEHDISLLASLQHLRFLRY